MLSKLLQLKEEMAAIMVAVDGLIKESSGPEPEISEFERFRRFVESENENLGEMLKKMEVAKFLPGVLFLEGPLHIASFVALHKGVLCDLLGEFQGLVVSRIRIEGQ